MLWYDILTAKNSQLTKYILDEHPIFLRSRTAETFVSFQNINYKKVI